MFTSFMVFIDLNSKVVILGHSSRKEGMAHEHRSNGFRPSHDVFPRVPLPKIRPALSRQPSRAVVLLSGSISLHGVRPTDLSRQFARHRNLPAYSSTQTLSCRH